MILVDTNIFIEIFKGNSITLESIKQIDASQIALSSITLTELYYGAKNKNELSIIENYLLHYRIIHLDENISSESLRLIKLYAKSHGLTIPDAIIASTLILYGYPPFTYNIKDFKYIRGLNLFSY